MNATKIRGDQRVLLLALFDEAFDKQAWHGPNLRGSIRRVSAEQAMWRPGPGRRNIAEIVVHCAYWKYAVRRRIRGDKRGSFPLKGSNWFALPNRLTAEQWREYVALLEEQHLVLRQTIATVPWSRLCDTHRRSRQPVSHVPGVAMHDIYHAGQIRTIRALYQQSTRPKKALAKTND